MATKTEQRQHVNAWIDPELARRLDENAAAADRSRSAEICRAIAAHVERERATTKEDQ